MEGQLSEHPLAELISEILEKRFSGALRVEHERVKAVVYFEEGELIYATANLNNYRLSEYIKKKGFATSTAGKDSLSDFEIAEALLAKGVISRATLDQIVAEQVGDVVRVLLLWTNGHWGFNNRARLTTPIQARIQIRQLLLDAARRMDPQFVASRIRTPDEVMSAVPDGAALLNLSSTEGFLLSRVEGPIAVRELVAISGLKEAETLQTIYGLVLTRVVARELWPHAFRTGEMQQAAKSGKGPAPKSATAANTPR